ncbi:MAG: DUF2490 domain-containing protein [Chloracidobacterium sp.]|nr:DUF2490 domain-containing protein [Chloracidobacterium sp.]
MNCIQQLPGLMLVIAVLIGFARAQASPDRKDNQAINDFQVSVPLTGRVDLLVLATARLGENMTDFSEGRLGGGISIRVGKGVSISPTYQLIQTRVASGTFRTEHRYSLRASYRFPFKKFGLTHRSTYEYRVRSSGNSWRYRPSLSFQRGLPKRFIPKASLFITEEPFYVSTTRRFSRNRFTMGVSKTINDHLTLDIYYMRQQDGVSRPGDLNVLGTSWRIRL